MKRLLRCGGLFLLLLAFIVPTFAGDDTKKKEGDDPKKTDVKKKDGDDTDPKKKKDGDDTDPKKKKEVKEKFAYGFKFMGKITALDTNSAAKDFTMQITNKVTELDQGVRQQLMDQQRALQQHQLAYARAKDANGRQNALNQYNQTMQQIAQSQAKLYKVKDVTTDKKFRVADNVIYRTLFPEPEFNDKGELTPPGPKDLERMKGAHKDLPGYHAEAEILRNGQTVAVYTPKTNKVQPKDLKKKTTDDDDAVVSDRMEVILIVIVNAKQNAPK